MHVSLDSALGRQRRLNSVGESVLQIAPSAAAAYSLRSLTGGDPKVVRVRRASDNHEQDFTASGVSSGALVDFVNQIQTVGTAVNGTGSFDNYTVSNLSTTGFSADNSAGGTGSAGFPYVFKDEDVIVVKYTVTNFSSTASLSPQIRGVNATSSVTGQTNSGTAFTANGTYTDTLTATADGTHLMFADGNTGSYTIGNFEIVSHSSSGFVETWYDQSGNGNDATQLTASNQPKIVGEITAGQPHGLLDGLTFDGIDNFLNYSGNFLGSSAASSFSVSNFDSASASSREIIYGLQDASGNRYDYLVTRQSNGKIDFYVEGNSEAGSGLSIADTNKHLLTAIYVDTEKRDIFDDGALGHSFSNYNQGALTDGTNFLIGQDILNSNRFDGSIAELIVYNTDQSSNRVAVETNIAAEYGITLS